MKLAQNNILVQCINPRISLFPPSFVFCLLSRPNSISDRNWKALSLVEGVWVVGWGHVPTKPPHPTNSEAHPFPLHTAHPCATVPISCADHTCWRRLLGCTGARLAWMFWHVPMVWRGIRAQLSECGSLLWISAAMQSSGFAGRTLFRPCICSVLVSWSVSGSVCLHLSAFLSLLQTQISFFLSLRLLLSTICSEAWLQDCFWRCQILVLGNAKLHRLQDISLFQLSKSIQEIKWNSICDRKLFNVIKASVFPTVIPHFPANWPDMTLNLLSRLLFMTTGNAQATKPQ